MHGSHDGDVYDFAGQETYDRAHPVNARADRRQVPALRLWRQPQLLEHGLGADPGDRGGAHGAPAARNAAGDREGLRERVLPGDPARQRGYKALLTDDVTFPSLPAGVTRVHQYQDRTRLFINHFEEDGNLATGSVPGVTNTNHDGLPSTLTSTTPSGTKVHPTGSGRRPTAWSPAGPAPTPATR